MKVPNELKARVMEVIQDCQPVDTTLFIEFRLHKRGEKLDSWEWAMNTTRGDDEDEFDLSDLINTYRALVQKEDSEEADL